MIQLKVLHLSDPLFSTDQSQSSGLSRARIDYFFDAIAEFDPNLIYVTGDVARSGKAAEYSKAVEFFSNVRKKWPDIPFILVPGDHDVSYDAGLEADQRQDTFVDFLFRILPNGEAREVFPLIGRLDSVNLSRRERITPVLVTSTSVVVGVNSAAYSSTASNQPEPVYIRSQVMRGLEDELRTKKVAPTADERLRIFGMHHHPLLTVTQPEGKSSPVGSEKGSAGGANLANIGALREWLRKWSFDLVLHGHSHAPHVRVETLYLPPDSNPYRSTVIGGGSISESKRNSATLNLITATKSGMGNLRTQVEVCEFGHSGTYRRNSYLLGADVPHRTVVAITASDSADAYWEVRQRIDDEEDIRNFVCRIDNAQYVHPESSPFAFEEIVRWFRALNPQLSPTGDFRTCANWTLTASSEVLGDRNTAHYPTMETKQLRHGDRIFVVKPGASASPWDLMLEAYADSPRRRRAYISLFETANDAISEPSAVPPGLVGIQLSEGDARGYVDITGVFRHLELSKWFLVNCYELAALLNLAVNTRELERVPKLGSINLIATTASWSPSSAQTVVASHLDLNLPLLQETILKAIRQRTSKRQSEAQQILAEWLLDKSQILNPSNMDLRGLTQLLSLLNDATVRNHRVMWDEVKGRVALAHTLLKQAVEGSSGDKYKCAEAANELVEASRMLWINYESEAD